MMMSLMNIFKFFTFMNTPWKIYDLTLVVNKGAVAVAQPNCFLADAFNWNFWCVERNGQRNQGFKPEVLTALVHTQCPFQTLLECYIFIVQSTLSIQIDPHIIYLPVLILMQEPGSIFTWCL